MEARQGKMGNFVKEWLTMLTSASWGAQSGSLGSWIHSAPKPFLSGLHRALCLQAVVHGKSLSAQIYWFLLAEVHPTGSKLSCISKFHHLDPLMAAQDASVQALRYSVSFKPRSMRCQTSRYVAGWLSSATVTKWKGLVLIRAND